MYLSFTKRKIIRCMITRWQYVCKVVRAFIIIKLSRSMFLGWANKILAFFSPSNFLSRHRGAFYDPHKKKVKDLLEYFQNHLDKKGRMSK